ncbi:FG-nucleoporin nsp1 [Tulasnella sp. 417]|nr:FG-nucleoporin nsp1 [Tulasnella sp. 417]
MSNPSFTGFAGFGAPSNTANPSAGSSSTAQQPSTGLFGAANPSATSTTSVTPGNLFGGAASSSTAPKPFTGFGFGTNSTGPASGGLFGGTPATATTAAGSTNTAPTGTAPAIGTGATTIFGAAASKPGSLFGNPAPTTGTAAPALPAGSLFGTATPTATAAPSGSLFGGNLFGGAKPATAPATTSTTPAPGATAGQASTTTTGFFFPYYSTTRRSFWAGRSQASGYGFLNTYVNHFAIFIFLPLSHHKNIPTQIITAAVLDILNLLLITGSWLLVLAIAAPATGLFAGFGKPPGTTPASTTTPSIAVPNLFGGPAKDASKDTTAPTSTTATTAAPAFGGFTLGAPPLATANKDSKDSAKDATATSTAAQSTTAPALGSLFAAKPPGTTTATPALTPSLGATASTTAAPALGSLFGGAKDTAASTAAATTKPSVPALFGAPGVTATPATGATGIAAATADASKTSAAPVTGTAAPTMAATAAANSATTAPPLLPPSVLKGKTLEEIVDSWGTDLEKQAAEFKRIGGEVQEWDRVLMDNGNQIATLYALVLQAEKTQSDVEKSLDHIEEQQRQLSNTLDGYEKGTMEILDSQGMRTTDVGPADTERDKNYMLATSLNQQLDDLARNLSSMIDEVNSVTATSQHGSKMKPTDNTTSLATTTATGQGDVTMEDADAMDPMGQIQAILNAHLDSLSWINTSVRELEGKVGDLEGKFGGVLPPSEERQQRPVRGGLQQQSTLLEGSGSILGGSRYGMGSSFRR